MPHKGVDAVRRNLAQTFERIAGPMTERTLTEVLIIGGSGAALLTPVDTSNLINSQYRRIEAGPNGLRGRVGYTANYAAAVHSMPGTLDGQPRADFGNAGFGGGTGVGNYWDPNAEPEFLTKGFEQNLGAIRAAIKRGMQV